MAQRLVETARREVGVRETRTNGGPRIVEYQKATWLEPGAWAWCAAFVCWCVRDAALGGGDYSFELPQTAGAWDFENWCRAQDNTVRLRKPPADDIRAGDILVYTFSHIGIATGPPDKDGNVPTVEGNTNGSGSREGDGVYAKLRPVSKIRSRIRFTQ